MADTTTKTTNADQPPAAHPLALDARSITVSVFPDIALRTWRRLDASGACPRGFTVGRRKLWRLDDLERWADWGFCDRREFEVRMKGKTENRN